MFPDRLSISVLVAFLSGCAATASGPGPVIPSSPDWTRLSELVPEGGETPASSARGPCLAPRSAELDPTVTELPPTVPALQPSPLVANPPSESHDGSAGQWELTLGASGASDKEVKDGAMSGAAGIGYYLSDHFELAARQSIFWVDGPAAGSDTNASTRLAADINFGSGTFRPILGVNAGYVYGDTVRDTWIAGPEAGFKLYIKNDVFIQLLAEYQFFFQKGDEIDDEFDNGSLVYSLGIGVNF